MTDCAPDNGQMLPPWAAPAPQATVNGLPLVTPAFDVECPRCQRLMSAHDADPIGAGLTQYTCPEPS